MELRVNPGRVIVANTNENEGELNHRGKVGAGCRALCANFCYNYVMNYQVIIHDAEEGGYWAEVTGMPGCYSQGETLAETKANIQEAAMAWMESQVAMALRKVA